MKKILAVLNKKSGRGWMRHWTAWEFNTPVQQAVEHFLYLISQSDYFLVDPAGLTKNSVGNYMLDNIQVLSCSVKVKNAVRNPVYTLRD